MLKIHIENDAKNVPKWSQKGCQEGLKIEVFGGKMGTRSDISSYFVSEAILKRNYMIFSAPVEAATLKLRNRVSKAKMHKTL